MLRERLGERSVKGHKRQVRCVLLLVRHAHACMRSPRRPFASPQVQRELEEQAEAAAARKDLHPSAQKVVTKE